MKDFIVPACLFLFTSFTGGILHWKSKADKADVEKIVDKKIKNYFQNSGIHLNNPLSV